MRVKANIEGNLVIFVKPIDIKIINGTNEAIMYFGEKPPLCFKTKPTPIGTKIQPIVRSIPIRIPINFMP